MNDFDFIDAHVHTTYSQNDCKQPMDGYLDLLRQGKARGFGFADHMHPPAEVMSGQYEAMNAYRFNGDGYTRDIQNARSEGLQAYAGVEVTYEKDYHEACTRRALENDYDYRVVSVHSFGGFWVTRTYWQSVQPGPMFLDLCNRYYDAILEALEVEWADVVAHIGVYRRFLPDTHQLMVCAQSLIDRREEEVARACAISGKIIEVNTSGLDAPGQVTMPSDAFLIKYAKHGGDKLCLSSDAHDVARANSGFAQTAANLKSLGFDKLALPWDKGKTIAL